MNTNTVVSLPVSADLSAYSHVAVKLTSTGIALADANDRIIGTMIRGNRAPLNSSVSVVGQAAAVFLSAGNGFHEITVGNNTAIAMGDELMQWGAGRFAKRGSSVTGTGEVDDDLITITDHGFSSGDRVAFSVLTSGTGLSLGITYYVIAAGLTANTFSVSLTSGGAAVNLTGSDYTVITVAPGETSGGAVAAIAVDSAPTSSIGGIINAIVLSAGSAGGGTSNLAVATTLTAADSGKIFFLELAAGFTTTLPLASAVPGGTFTFICKTVNTGDYVIAGAGTDDIVGYPIASLGSDETGNGSAVGESLAFKANVSLPSDKAVFTSDGNRWYVTATCKATGAIIFTA